MQIKIQVVENSDRFHVSQDGTPIYTFLFAVPGSVGVTKAFAQMNANSEAWKLAVKKQNDGYKVKLLEQQSK